MNNKLHPPKIQNRCHRLYIFQTTARYWQFDQTTSNDRLNNKKEIRGEMITINCYRILLSKRLSSITVSHPTCCSTTVFPTELPSLSWGRAPTMTKRDRRDKAWWRLLLQKSETKSFPKCDAISGASFAGQQIDECPGIIDWLVSCGGRRLSPWVGLLAGWQLHLQNSFRKEENQYTV